MKKRPCNLEICKRNKTKKKIKIKIVLNKKGFQSAFRTEQKASGEYISFLGDDDKLVKNIFIILIKKLNFPIQIG